MTTLPLSVTPRILPTRLEVREMLNRTSVLITAIIAGAAVIIAFVAAIVVLVMTEHTTEALTTAVIGPLLVVMTSVINRVKSLEQTVERSPNIQTPPTT